MIPFILFMASQDSMDAPSCYAYADYEVWDLLPRNVLKDNDGDIYVIDAEIEKQDSSKLFKGQHTRRV